MESFLFLVFFVFIAGRQLFVYCVFAGSAGYGGYGYNTCMSILYVRIGIRYGREGVHGCAKASKKARTRKEELIFYRYM